jgi:outer membrane protein assembly factor BamB
MLAMKFFSAMVCCGRFIVPLDMIWPNGYRAIAFFLAAASLSGANWPTFAGDPQRDGWAKAETSLSKVNAKDIKLEWKIQLDNISKELNSLTAPTVVEKLVTPQGFKDVVIVAGSADRVFAIDVDSGKLMWQKNFVVRASEKPSLGFLCPNALNATPVIDPAMMRTTVYVLASDGMLHALNAVDGEDRIPPMQFVPPESKAWSLNLFGDSIYTTVSQGCGGTKSGVYSLNLKDSKHATESFGSGAAGGSGIWGRGGSAISSGGTVYVETGDGAYNPTANEYADSFVALSSKDLSMTDYYTPANHLFLTHKDLDMGAMSPLVFAFKGRDIVAGGGKEGVLYLLDGKALGGTDHKTPLFRSPKYANEELNLAGRGFWGALATWQDETGTRWLYAPAQGPQAAGSPEFKQADGAAPHGSIMAFKVDEQNGKVVLEPMWRSRDMSVPEPPIVANGVVYALSNGENTQSIHASGRLMTSQERSSTPTGNAVLYAFDAVTGKELFSSAKSIAGFSHFSGLALANGHVYVVTYENVLYSFGLGDNGQ